MSQESVVESANIQSNPSFIEDNIGIITVVTVVGLVGFGYGLYRLLSDNHNDSAIKVDDYFEDLGIR